jgi:hypothetical protein
MGGRSQPYRAVSLVCALALSSGSLTNCKRNPALRCWESKMDQHASTANTTDAGLASRVAVGSRTTSPSGRYTVELLAVDASAPREGQLLRLRIMPAGSQEALFESITAFAAWFHLQVLWDADDRIWVESTDERLRFWAVYEERWTEFVWQSGGPLFPDTNAFRSPRFLLPHCTEH